MPHEVQIAAGVFCIALFLGCLLILIGGQVFIVCLLLTRRNKCPRAQQYSATAKRLYGRWKIWLSAAPAAVLVAAVMTLALSSLAAYRTHLLRQLEGGDVRLRVMDTMRSSEEAASNTELPRQPLILLDTDNEVVIHALLESVSLAPTFPFRASLRDGRYSFELYVV
jgi:hypothetical protein